MNILARSVRDCLLDWLLYVCLGNTLPSPDGASRTRRTGPKTRKGNSSSGVCSGHKTTLDSLGLEAPPPPSVVVVQPASQRSHAQWNHYPGTRSSTIYEWKAMLLCCWVSQWANHYFVSIYYTHSLTHSLSFGQSRVSVQMNMCKRGDISACEWWWWPGLALPCLALLQILAAGDTIYSRLCS